MGVLLVPLEAVTWECMHTRTHTYKQEHSQTCLHTHTHNICTHTQTHTHTHINANKRTHTCTHIRKHIHPRPWYSVDVFVGSAAKIWKWSVTFRVHLQQRKWLRWNGFFSMPASEVRAQKYTYVCVYSCIMVCAGRRLDSGRRQYVVLNWMDMIFDITTFTLRESPLHLSFQYVLQ